MQKIAIIGGGISGLVAAWLLGRRHRVTLFESNEHMGGHTHTHSLQDPRGSIAVDSGFIVFNDRTYPNFIRLLDQLGVASQPAEMSFSMRADHEDLEYNGHTLLSLFAQHRNLFRPRFHRMLADILRFNRLAKDFAQTASSEDMTLGQFLSHHNFGTWMRDYYVLPMTSAIWSAGLREAADFPMITFASFFANHGLLDVTNRPQWRVVTGGSQTYVRAILNQLREEVLMNTPVQAVRRNSQRVFVTAGGKEQEFDQVVLACHSDQALGLLHDPSESEWEVLGAIPYRPNVAILHTDTSILPRRRAAWASWNYNLNNHSPADHQPILTYNMNILQGLKTAHTYLVTLNAPEIIDPGKVIKRMTYDHPVYNRGTIAAQQKWDRISGVNRTHYCGAYWGYGFHEDGVKSAIRVADSLA